MSRVRGQTCGSSLDCFLRWAWTSGYQGRRWQPLSVHLWAHWTLQPMMNDDVSDKDKPKPRELRPLLFSNSVWVIKRPTELYVNEVYETGPTDYCPHPRRLESPTICRCHYKDSTFSSVILRPWVLVRQGFELKTSRSAGRRSPNWPNRAAVRSSVP